MRIDFSACSDDDVAELMIAATQKCGWLCERNPNKHTTLYCGKSCVGNTPYHNIEYEDVCLAHSAEIVSKQEIFRQCWAEIERRSRG